MNTHIAVLQHWCLPIFVNTHIAVYQHWYIHILTLVYTSIGVYQHWVYQHWCTPTLVHTNTVVYQMRGYQHKRKLTFWFTIISAYCHRCLVCIPALAYTMFGAGLDFAYIGITILQHCLMTKFMKNVGPY